jgi:hypothetical protein
VDRLGARFGGGSDLGSLDAGRSATSLAACIFAAATSRLVQLVAQLLRLIDNLPWASAEEGRDLGCGFMMLDAPLQVPEVPLLQGSPLLGGMEMENHPRSEVLAHFDKNKKHPFRRCTGWLGVEPSQSDICSSAQTRSPGHERRAQ